MTYLDCPCRVGTNTGAGFWSFATHVVTQAQRDEAVEYRECVDKYHRDGPSYDAAFSKNMKPKEILARVAETSAGLILHSETAPCQKSGKLIRRVDLLIGAGVRWNGAYHPVLYMKSPIGGGKEVFKGALDPLDEPEILAVGNLKEQRLLGFMTMREVEPNYKQSGRWWLPKAKNWAIPYEYLHRLPLHTPGEFPLVWPPEKIEAEFPRSAWDSGY